MCELRKNCKACGENKLLSEFNKSKENRDGRVGKCKVCQKNKIPIVEKIPIAKEGYKICTSCKEERDLSYYVKDKNRIDGLAGNCKLCRKQNKENIKNTEKTIPLIKECFTCKINKESTLFSKSSQSYDGLESNCKQCITEKYYKNLENKVYIDVDFKVCSRCNIEKSIKDFHKSISSKDGYNISCAECTNVVAKNYYYENQEERILYERARRAENPERSREINRKSYHNSNKEERARQSKIFRANNKEKIARDNKKWREDNKEYVKQKKREYTQNNRHVTQAWLKKKKAEDPLFKMSVQIRVNFNNIFNRVLDNKLVKNKASLDILGCSFEDFFKHIENQFLPWMTFENHGLCKEGLFDCTWHFDHIVPVSYAKTEEEVYLLNHWSNFQPLCGKRNLMKNGHIFPCTNLELGITFWEDRYEYIDKLKNNSSKSCRIK